MTAFAAHTQQSLGEGGSGVKKAYRVFHGRESLVGLLHLPYTEIGATTLGRSRNRAIGTDATADRSVQQPENRSGPLVRVSDG